MNTTENTTENTTDNTMEDVKPDNLPHIYNPSLPSCTDLPMKTGEIFRNNDGQYSFMCFHCGLIFDDFGEIINHCESHYQDEKYDHSLHPSEFVLCAETGPVLTQDLNSFLPEMTSIALNDTSNPTENSKVTVDTSNPTENSKVTVRRRKRKRSQSQTNFLLNIPQNCPMCDVWCDDFRGHMKKVHNVPFRVIQCYMCKKFFKSISLLKSHIPACSHTKNHCYHCEMEPPIKHSSEARRHKCLFCKEWFPNHVEFKVHFKEAHDKDADYFFHKRANCNIFTCYVCEREFPLRYYLVAHMRTHFDKFLRHQCPTCGKRVRTYGQLTQHLKTHEGKTFPCDQCDKKFSYFVRLRLHRLSHATELNYKCDLCPKAFKQRKYLLTHKAIHTNEKRYACKFCDATFNFTSARRAHEKSQHGAL